jgi:hypothetical protein
MRHRLWPPTVLLVVSALIGPGCRYGTERCIEQRVTHLGTEPFDLSTSRVPSPAATISSPSPAASPDFPRPQPTATRAGFTAPDSPLPTTGSERAGSVVRPVAFAEDAPPAPPRSRGRFNIPDTLPGAGAPPLRLPPVEPNQSPSQRQAQIATLFKPLPPLPPTAVPAARPDVAPWSLADLQQIAYENSPSLRVAAAAVDAARGAAIQAGLYPNPEVGYQGDRARGTLVKQSAVPTSPRQRVTRVTAPQRLVEPPVGKCVTGGQHRDARC